MAWLLAPFRADPALIPILIFLIGMAAAIVLVQKRLRALAAMTVVTTLLLVTAVLYVFYAGL
jgi:hypothetical protein